MPSALRPYVTAGVALVGASVISVTPISPAQIMSANSAPRVSSAAVDLVASSTSCTGAAATSDVCSSAFPAPAFLSGGTPSAFQLAADELDASVFNIPANLLIALANVPYNFLSALGTGDDGTGAPLNLGALPNSGFSFIPGLNNITLTQPDGHVVGLTSDLNYAGNIWVYSPTNVLGTDPGDIARYQALANVAIPFPALSVGLGNIFATVAASLLPMNVGCTGTGAGACPNINGILSNSLNFSNVFSLFSPGGYTFPASTNPITCNATGQCNILDPNGVTTPQSGQTIALDVFAPFTNFYNSLTVTPDFTKIKIPTIEMAVNTFANLIGGFNTFLNPFVLGTQCGLCSLVVPNPDNLPIPGPTNPGTEPIIGPATGSTTLVAAAKQDSDESEGGVTAFARSSRLGATNVVETATTDKVTPEETTPAETPPAETDKTAGTEGDSATGTNKSDTDKTTDSDKTATDKTTDSDTKTDSDKSTGTDGDSTTGGKHRKPAGGLTGAIAKITDRLSGGSAAGDDAKSGDSTKDSTKGGESGAGASKEKT